MGPSFLYKYLLSAEAGDRCGARQGFTAGSSEAISVQGGRYLGLHLSPLVFCVHVPLFLALGPAVCSHRRAKPSPHCGFVEGWGEVVGVSAPALCWDTEAGRRGPRQHRPQRPRMTSSGWERGGAPFSRQAKDKFSGEMLPWANMPEVELASQRGTRRGFPLCATQGRIPERGELTGLLCVKNQFQRLSQSLGAK